MSGVAFTVGSFGDFVSLLQLTLAVRKAFSEVIGASDNIREALAAIDSFSLAIEGAQKSLEKASGIPICVQNGIDHALAASTRALLRVQRRIEPHKQRIVKAHGKSAWKGYWGACGWALLGKAEVDSLVRQLVDQVVALQTFLGLLHSTAMDKIESRQDIAAANVSQILTCLDSLVRIQSHVPFQFFDHRERAVHPLLKMSWAKFVDFWTEHDFQTDASDICHGELYKVLYAEAVPGNFVWFHLYLYADPLASCTTTALISPIYFNTRPEDKPQRSDTLCRLFLASAKWLAKTLESPISTRAPLVGPRNRQQLIHLETGFSDDVRGSLHTRQYFLDAAPGPTQPEGRTSTLFEFLNMLGGLDTEVINGLEISDDVAHVVETQM